MGHISGLTYKKAKLFVEFLGKDKKYILDNKITQIMRVIIKQGNEDVRVVLDDVEQVWPNRHINKLLQT